MEWYELKYENYFNLYHWAAPVKEERNSIAVSFSIAKCTGDVCKVSIGVI
jgi:hypothetical protein